MGYYTSYTLDVYIPEDSKYNINQIMDYITKYNDEECLFSGIGTDCCFSESDICYTIYPDDSFKWYEHDNDMVALSLKFPNVSFYLTGEGEEREDVWEKRFLNGVVHQRELESHWGHWILRDKITPTLIEEPCLNDNDGFNSLINTQ